jgi:hypothetical protein
LTGITTERSRLIFILPSLILAWFLTTTGCTSTPFTGETTSTHTLKPTAPTTTPTATAMAHLTPTSTSLPTATRTPAPEPLSKRMGFLDTAIDQIQETYTNCEIDEQEETRLETSLLVAYVIRCDTLSHLLAYRHETLGPETNHHLMLNRSGDGLCLDCATSGSSWQDVDKDDLPDLIFQSLIGVGNNSYRKNDVYRTTEEGKMEDLFDSCPFSEPGMSEPSFQDVDENGTVAIVATDLRWDYDRTDGGLLGFYMPQVTRVYSLQNCEYQDVSASYPELYQHTIHVFFRNYEYILPDRSVREITVFSAFDGLLACDAVGRRDECWLAFWEMTDLDKHPLESTIGPNVTPDASTLRFVEWVNELRTTLELQYEVGLPFDPETP